MESKFVEINGMEKEEQKAHKVAILGNMTTAEARVKFIKALEDNLDEESLALASIFVKSNKSGSGTGSGQPTKQDLLRQMFLENPRIHEFEIFKALRMGGHDVTQAAHALRTRCTNPEDIVWIQRDDADDEYYVLKGTGPDMPEDWTERKRAKTVTPFQNAE